MIGSASCNIKSKDVNLKRMIVDFAGTRCIRMGLWAQKVVLTCIHNFRMEYQVNTLKRR